MVGGGEAALGWTLADRVDAIEAPVAAEDCVRLERTLNTITSSLLACAALGVIERVEREGDAVRERWRLVRVGPRSSGEVE